MTCYDPQEIRDYYPGYVGTQFAGKATDEDIINMARLKDETARILNAEILPRVERIKALQLKYGIQSDRDGIETGGAHHDQT
jgi:hypothetical protein